MAENMFETRNEGSANWISRKEQEIVMDNFMQERNEGNKDGGKKGGKEESEKEKGRREGKEEGRKRTKERRNGKNEICKKIKKGIKKKKDRKNEREKCGIKLNRINFIFRKDQPEQIREKKKKKYI